MGTDQTILEAARVSYKSVGKGEEADKKLLGYLWKHKHTSPFEMVKIMLNIKMPIFVMRQYVRHRMQNLNEVSARYTELPNEFYIPTAWRPQDTKNKQGSIITEDWDPELVEGLAVGATSALIDHCKASYELYEKMIKAGVAREMARMCLPVNIYTEIYSCWDLKNLLHFVTLRDDPHAQYEIQVYGKAIKQMLNELFPWTLAAFERYKFQVIDNQTTE
jgi:thymidylate synthase (FAD)